MKIQEKSPRRVRSRAGTAANADLVKPREDAGIAKCAAAEAEARAAYHRGQVAEAAYFIAEKRGFGPGHEIEDWLAAEAEVDRTCAAPW
jgi:hypothetical protein